MVLVNLLRVSFAGLILHFMLGKTCELKAPVGVPMEKALLCCEQPRRTDCSNTSSIFSTGNISNFRFSDIGNDQFSTMNCASVHLSDGSIIRGGGNSLDASTKPQCSLHLATFNFYAVTKIGQQP